MRPTPYFTAQLSILNITSRRSFDKLDRTPSTVFQYYYRLQIKQLHKYSQYIDSLESMNQNNPFRRQVRKEWDALSLSKKRVYHALYFHFLKLDFRKLSQEELAKRLEIPVPTSSEYLLFRNKFKSKFDYMWEKQYTGRLEIEVKVRSDTFGKFKITRYATKKKEDLDSITNFTERFQKMCRECKRIWKEKVSEEQKDEIRSKLRENRKKFELQMEKEVEALESLQENLTCILDKDTFHSQRMLGVERPASRTTIVDERLTLYFLNKKK